jgi:molybdate transport system substrate-binding protein
MRSLRDFLIGAFAILVALVPSVAAAADITVFAAASLTDALNEINSAWTKETSHSAAISFAASSALARQIEAGSPADMFISADTDWMDYLDHRNLIQRQTRRDLLGNHLVLIEPAASHTRISIVPHFALAAALGGGRLAVADPDSVPAGKYARASLTALGVWDSVANRLAGAENVRLALKYVARGDAPLGIVYTTDAMSEPQVRIAGTFPDATHAPIVYPVALTVSAKPLAREFLSYLTGAHASAVFRKDGFIVLNGGR